MANKGPAAGRFYLTHKGTFGTQPGFFASVLSGDALLSYESQPGAYYETLSERETERERERWGESLASWLPEMFFLLTLSRIILLFHSGSFVSCWQCKHKALSSNFPAQMSNPGVAVCGYTPSAGEKGTRGSRRPAVQLV